MGAFRRVLRVAAGLAVGIGCSLSALSATASMFHGVDFPGGVSSFVDEVVSYDPFFNPAGLAPAVTYRDASQALGAPNLGDPGAPDPAYVSLGAGGRIVLRFTNNALTGSGTTANDLWIFEIGPDVEDTDVDISKDGTTWHSIGKVTGSTRGIDIDAFGFGTTDFFAYVRLTDVLLEGDRSGATVGADIDAVGAISSAPPVPPPTGAPEPATLALLGVGLAVLGWRRSRR